MPGLSKSSLLIALLIFSFSCTSKKPDKVVVPPTPTLGNINFYIETSASMGGYFKSGADLSKIIPNFLVEVENRINNGKGININFIADTIRRYTKNTKDFIHDISTTEISNDKTSEMHRLFEMVTSKAGPNDISIFVSDCILSYSNEDIKRNKEINKDNADGELKATIKSVFLKLAKKNICASLYAFNSSFEGIYYNYQNGRESIAKGATKRPFYIWVFGPRELLADFNKRLSDLSNFAPELVIDFGLFQNPVQQYDILFKTERSGNWTAGVSEIKEIEFSQKKPLQFAIAVDLSYLPQYATNKKNLLQRLKISPKNCAVELVAVKLKTEIDIAKSPPREKQLLEGDSHVFVFNIKDMVADDASFTVSLPLEYSTEYEKWSIMDDRNVSDISGKTFAFIHLVDGVREAYQRKNQDFINISIKLKK